VALRRGAMTTVLANGKTYAFARHHPGAPTVLIALNAGREPVTLDLRVEQLFANGTRLVEEWTREEIIVQGGYAREIALAPRAGTVWSAYGV